MATAVYPGSFDPVTKGHLDIIKRAAKINDHLIVAVLINSAKDPLFTVEERVALLTECCKGIPNVSVESFDGLTVEFAKKRHASVMVRGLRAVTDFENEIQLAQTNHALMPGIETMFLATSIKWSYLSSTIVKEAARYGSDIGKFTGYYYTFSMAAQVVTPVLAGTLMRHISYRVLFPYAALFVGASFVTMCFVHHGDSRAEAKSGLAAFEDMDD